MYHFYQNYFEKIFFGGFLENSQIILKIIFKDKLDKIKRKNTYISLNP